MPTAEKHLTALLEPNATSSRLAAALRLMVATANHTKATPIPDPQSATELLAASYDEQSRAILDDSLRRALELAKQAVERSPEFGFGWARVAELEFSFGRTRETLAALNKSLTLAPRNAQAIALKGFVQAAQNRTSEALQTFNDAIAADSALGNAWLGRGLVRIRRGDRKAGHEDLLIAAAMEPRRSLLRSYLAKAWNDGGDPEQALKELALAKRLDPADPTPWLYSALLNEQGNRLNDAIRDLERSQQLNKNRRVYRSKLLLDQDRAVANMNQARVFHDLGMTDVAVRQAGRAVMLDPTEHSAHSFLAYSTDLVRDPRKVNLRYETPTLSEYLMANLLGSAEDTILSPSTARGSTDRLLKADGFQFVSATEYRDSGEWREAGALSLTEQGTSLAVDTILRRDPDLRPNEDLDESEVNFRWRQQLSDRDTLFMEAQTYRAIGGDLNQYENPSEDFNPTYRSEERQDPIITAGFHRKWSDNQHTLLLFNHLQDRFSVMNHYQEAVIVSTDSSNVILGADPISREQSYESQFQIESGEAQHIIRHGREY